MENKQQLMREWFECMTLSQAYAFRDSVVKALDSEVDLEAIVKDFEEWKALLPDMCKQFDINYDAMAESVGIPIDLIECTKSEMQDTDLHRLTGRMLDIGSGILEYDDVLGMDSVESGELSLVGDEAFQVEAQAHIESHSPTCKAFIQQMDSDTPLPVPDNFYHHIRYHSALCYVYLSANPTFKKVAKEIVRVLAVGGTAIIWDSLSDVNNKTLKELQQEFNEAFDGCSVTLYGEYEGEESDDDGRTIYFLAYITKYRS